MMCKIEEKLHSVTKKTHSVGKEKKILNKVTKGDVLGSKLGGKDWERAGEDRTWLDT